MQLLYPEGVTQHSPGSLAKRAQPWVWGRTLENLCATLSGWKRTGPWSRPQVRSLRERPWAVLCNPFGVNCLGIESLSFENLKLL